METAFGGQRAQGTIEYLVILAVVVVIGLVVVGLVTTTFSSPAQQLSSATTNIGASTGPISISESVLDIGGDGLMTLSNNSGNSLTISKVSVGGSDTNYESAYLPAGSGTTFSLADVAGSCSCAGAAGSTKTCEVIVYAVSEYGIQKTYSYSVTVECVEDAQPKNPAAVTQPYLGPPCSISSECGAGLSCGSGACRPWPAWLGNYSNWPSTITLGDGCGSEFNRTYYLQGDGSYTSPCDDGSGGHLEISYPWANAWQLMFGCTASNGFAVPSGPKELGPFMADWGYEEMNLTCFENGYWTD